MKKALAILAVATSVISARADLIAAYNTFGNLGTETNEPVATTAANITASDINAVGITPNANGNRFGGTDWVTNSLPFSVTNDFLQWTITADPGFTFTPTNIIFSFEHSATGPSNLSVRSSVDGFASDLFVVGPVPLGPAVQTGVVSSITDQSSVTFRLYAFDSRSPAGAAGLDEASSGNDLIINGTVAVVPEPASMAMFGIGAFAAAWSRRRLHAARA